MRERQTDRVIYLDHANQARAVRGEGPIELPRASDDGSPSLIACGLAVAIVACMVEGLPVARQLAIIGGSVLILASARAIGRWWVARREPRGWV
jgi:hypothetical protein